MSVILNRGIIAWSRANSATAYEGRAGGHAERRRVVGSGRPRSAKQRHPLRRSTSARRVRRLIIDAPRRRRAGGIDALVGQNHNVGDPIITRRGGIQFRLSTDVAPGDKYSGVGPHHHSDRRRRRAPSRTSRTRRRRRRRGRLLLSSTALLPPHITFPPARAAAVAFRSGQFPGKPAKIPKPLAALAPLEVAARARVDPRRLVALAADVLVLFWYDGAAAADRRHGRRRRRRDGLLARDRFLWRALTTHDHGHGRVALSGRRRPRHRWSSPSVRTRLPSAHDAVSCAPCFGSRVVHEGIVRGSLAPQYPVQWRNVGHLYC